MLFSLKTLKYVIWPVITTYNIFYTQKKFSYFYLYFVCGHPFIVNVNLEARMFFQGMLVGVCGCLVWWWMTRKRSCLWTASWSMHMPSLTWRRTTSGWPQQTKEGEWSCGLSLARNYSRLTSSHSMGQCRHQSRLTPSHSTGQCHHHSRHTLPQYGSVSCLLILSHGYDGPLSGMYHCWQESLENVSQLLTTLVLSKIFEKDGSCFQMPLWHM